MYVHASKSTFTLVCTCTQSQGTTFEKKSLIGQELANLSRVADQRAPLTGLSLPPQHWDHKHVQISFLMWVLGSGDWTCDFTDWATFPAMPLSLRQNLNLGEHFHQYTSFQSSFSQCKQNSVLGLIARQSHFQILPLWGLYEPQFCFSQCHIL